MSARVIQFLKTLRHRNPHYIAAELRCMGVYIRSQAEREELMKAIDALDLHKVKQHLFKLETVPATIVPKEKASAVHEALLLPPELAALRESLIQIHQKYLNQFGKQPMLHSQQSAETQRRSSVDEVNDLLGVTPEIRFDPKSIIHQHEYDSTTLTYKIFPTLTEKEYQQRLTRHKLRLKFIDTSTTTQQKLLMVYGIERQKQFFRSSIDFIQELLYPNKPIKQRVTKLYKPAALVKGFLVTFPQRQQYYLAVIASLSVVQLYRFITLINTNLHSIAVAPAIPHNFSLAVAQAIVRKSPILRTNPFTINGKSVLEWIGRSMRDFRTYLQSSEIDRPQVNTLLIILKRYSNIRRAFNQHVDQLPEQVLLQVSQREWIEPLMAKLEAVVDEVSLGELGGRRVAEKLSIIKTLIEFAANEQVELSQAFLQKLLVSIRNGLDALSGDEQSTVSGGLFVSEKQRLFGWEVVRDIIKVMFTNAEVAINVVPVISFLWSRFYHIATEDEQSIQSLFLLINVTARYKCEYIVQDQESAIFDLLSRSLETIARENYQQLRKKEVIAFLKEEAVLLLGNANREALLHKIDIYFEQQ